MIVFTVIAAALALAGIGYLIIALVKPERF
ncbi:MAG: potassium-transporting ATPase subunit F [Pseudolysinimonas sp.]